MRTETNAWVSRKALGILKEDAADTDLFLSSFETRTLSLSPPCSKQHVTLLNTESIIPIPKTIQVAPLRRVSPGLQKSRDGTSPHIRKSGWPGSIPISDDKGRVPEKMGEGEVSTLPWGRDVMGEGRKGSSLGGGKTELGAVCNN